MEGVSLLMENKIKRAYWFVKKCHKAITHGEEIWENEAHFYFDLRNIFGISRDEWNKVFPKGTSMKDKEALMY